MRNKLSVTFLAFILIVSTLGCNLFTGLFQDKAAVPISSEPPTLPAAPQPTVAIKGTAEEQAVFFVDQLASPETRFAGWLGLYDALGVPVIGQDRKPLGSTGDDPIGPRHWQVWYASGLDKKGRGIPLTDAGRLLAAGTPELDGAAFGPALLNDLRLALKSTDPQVRLMGMFVRERILRWASHADIKDADLPPEKAIIDLPTLQMLGWIAMRGVLFQTAGTGGKTVGALRKPAVFGLIMFQPLPDRPGGNPARQLPCSEKMGDADSTYWTNWLMNKVIGGGVQLPGMTKALPGIIESLQKYSQASEQFIEKTASVIAKLNLLSVALSFMLQLAAMEVNATQTADPLIRTKTTNRGTNGTLNLQLYSAPEKIPDGNELMACLGSFAANAFGVSFSLPAKGPISGAELTVEGGKGFPDLVLFNTEVTNSMRRWTETDGGAEYKVFGAPQKRQIPESAKQVDKEFSIHVSAQPEEAGLNSMLNIFFGGLTFGAAPSGAGGIGSVFDILKGFKYDMGEYTFRLTDWQQKGYKASGQLAAADGQHHHVFSGVICSLDQPFTVVDSNMLGSNNVIKFVPNGTFSLDTKFLALTYRVTGTYTVEGAGTDKPKIIIQGATGTASHPEMQGTGQWGVGIIDLTPLETDECGGE